jgi:hypothetical protein
VKRSSLATLGGVFLLVALAAFSEYLSLNRIFQVDELQNVFTARLLAKHLEKQYSAFASLMFFGPMMWLGGTIERSALLLRSERLLFFVLFWVNLCLIVHCAGVRLRSGRGVLALLLAATLAPLWDYGFEIRHDNALLTMILLAWSAARPLVDGGKRRLFLVGFVAVVSEFIAYKAFAYLVPIAFFAMAAAWLKEKRPLRGVVASTAAGALTALVVSVLIHLVAGTWSLFWTNLLSFEKVSTGKVIRFSAAPTLSRLIFETPLLLVAVSIALTAAARGLRSSGWFSRESLVPEVFLLAIAVGAILVNPTPFPYNLVLVTPQAAILVFRLAPAAVMLWSRRRVWQLVLSIALLVHGVVWLLITRRHVYMSNARQMELASTAEELTDPRVHAVFDGSGLVPTRHPPGYHWLIHSFSIGFFRSGAWEPIRMQLARGQTPVIIPNYRIVALPPDDLRFITAHYVPLSGDFFVAGTVLGTGQNRWDCLVPGRYYVGWDGGSGGVRIDGMPLAQPDAVVFTRGPHEVNTISPRVWVIWLGPHVKTPPRMGQGRPADVLVNWY